LDLTVTLAGTEKRSRLSNHGLATSRKRSISSQSNQHGVKKTHVHAKQKQEQTRTGFDLTARERQSDKNNQETSSFFPTNIQTGLQVKNQRLPFSSLI
jgi:hypothetical protein